MRGCDCLGERKGDRKGRNYNRSDSDGIWNARRSVRMEILMCEVAAEGRVGHEQSDAGVAASNVAKRFIMRTIRALTECRLRSAALRSATELRPTMLSGPDRVGADRGAEAALS